MTDITKLLLDKAPLFAALVLALISLSAFMDWKVRDELKTRFLRSLYGDRPHWATPTSITTPLVSYHSVVHTIFGLQSIWSFIRRSILVTFLMLFILFTIQAFIDETGFEDVTLPFIERLISLDGASLLLLAGVITVDLLSIYQTVIFLRISRGCKNFAEVCFLAGADLVLSLILFITIFPLFITLSFVWNKTPTTSFYIALDSSPTNQNSGAIEALRNFFFFDPREKPIVRLEDFDDLAKRNWVFRVYSLFMREDSENPPSVRAAVLEGRNSGNIVIQSRGQLTDVQVFDIFRKMLEKRPYIRKAVSLEASQGFFSANELMRLTIDSQPRFQKFWRTYAGVVRRVNFLDNDFIKVISLQSLSVSGNDIAFQYNMSLEPWRDVREQQVYCDGTLGSSNPDRFRQIDREFDKCKEAIVVDSQNFENIRSLAFYNYRSDAKIPISPLALSSLSATLMIYYLLLARVFFPFLHFSMRRTFRGGGALLKRHLFVVTSCAAIVIFLPVVLLIRFLVERL